MTKQIKVGVITHAQGAHLQAYFDSLANADEVESVVLADPGGDTFDMAEKSLGAKLAKTYRDRGEMLREAQPAMALVTMEAALAPPAIEEALDAGCHVFAEKPACVRVEDFAALVHKAQSKHLLLMLALANRLHAPIREARRLVQEGRFGKIYGLEMHIIADQTRLKSETYHRSWFAHKDRAGGGHLIWLGIHWLDLAVHITGLPIREVAAFTNVAGGQPLDVEDSASVVLRFAGDPNGAGDGCLGTMTSAYYLDKGYHQHIQIWGEHGWLRLGDLDKDPLEWYSTKDATSEGAAVQRFEYAAGQGGYAPFVRAAVRASAGLDEPPITGEECLQVLNTVFACYRSAGERRAMKVETRA